MRIRTIKPSFFSHDGLAECDPLARLLFIGLWCAADSEGRLEDRPKRLKVEILPYDDVDIDELLQQLVIGRFIIRYEAGGYKVIAILGWKEHQRIQGKESDIESKYPPPPEVMNDLAAVNHSGSNGEALGNHQGSNGETPIAQEGKGRKGKEGVVNNGESSGNHFNEFWSAWPSHNRKSDREKCFKHWNSKKLDRLFDLIMAGLEAWKRDPQWIKNCGEFIPMPYTWLNNRRWEGILDARKNGNSFAPSAVAIREDR